MVLIKPRKATHAVLETFEGKKALVSVDDLDTLVGTAGTLQWLRLTRTNRELLNRISFDGTIEEITSDYQIKRRKKNGG